MYLLHKYYSIIFSYKIFKNILHYVNKLITE